MYERWVILTTSEALLVFLSRWIIILQDNKQLSPTQSFCSLSHTQVTFHHVLCETTVWGDDAQRTVQVYNPKLTETWGTSAVNNWIILYFAFDIQIIFNLKTIYIHYVTLNLWQMAKKWPMVHFISNVKYTLDTISLL